MNAKAKPGALTDPELLEKIDKLFELNVGEYVHLPQLLVVGDQSSGKSFVLEGLTKIPFPRDSTLCTRFATQITFRRASEDNILMSAIPGQDASADHAEKIRSWKVDGLQSLDRETFLTILQQAEEIMDLHESLGSGAKRSFSNDILKIEVSGPKEEHFSVIDVPGIFKRATSGVTTKEDIAMVDKMVDGYMENQRSIILAVVPANVDAATQDILQRAEECDLDGRRTLGILTKPDLVDPGAEQNIMDIIEGTKQRLKLGWCLVKNPGQADLAKDDENFDRHGSEKDFFSTREPWSRLPRDRVGVAALRTRLMQILGEMIHREFPQYKYLTSLASKYQQVLQHALSAHDPDDSLVTFSDELRLITHFVNRNMVFADDMAACGQSLLFKDDKPEVSNEHGSKINGPQTTPGVIQTRRCKRKFDDLDDILSPDRRISEPDGTKSIDAWLAEVHYCTRGLELGTFDYKLLAKVFRHQSANWENIAFGYISDIIATVHSFINDLLQKLCHDDDRIRKGILTTLKEELVKRYKDAIHHTESLLKSERKGSPITMDPFFSEHLDKSRQDRYREQIEKNAFWSNSHNGNVVKIDSLVQIAAPKTSNTEHAIADLHDILKSYYMVALKRFVDSVVKQAADLYLITGEDTPSKLFSCSFVGELSPDEVDAIAGEESATQRKRCKLKRDMENLQKGYDVLK